MTDKVIENLISNLKARIELLTKIDEVLDSQADMLENPTLNESIFDDTMTELTSYFDKLEILDNELDTVTSGLELSGKNEQIYKEYEIDKLVAEINSYSEKIAPKLAKNQSSVDRYIGSQRAGVGTQKKSVAGISGYFKSMGGLSIESRTKDYKI